MQLIKLLLIKLNQFFTYFFGSKPKNGSENNVIIPTTEVITKTNTTPTTTPSVETKKPLFEREVVETSTPVLAISLSQDTVYITNTDGQTSYANLTIAITNNGNTAAQLADVAIQLPASLYTQGSLNSINPFTDAVWSFAASSTVGVFAAMPKSGAPNSLAPKAVFNFTLDNITIARQTTPAQATIEVKVKLGDGTIPPPTPLTVTIQEASAKIVSFTSQPTSIKPGESSTLSWECTEMDYCILSPPPNANNLPIASSAQVAPEISTTYTLDAYATNLHLQAQVNIDMMRPQVVSFNASKYTVDYNTSTSLSWATLYADSVLLTITPQLPTMPANLPINTNNTPVVVGPLTEAITLTLIPEDKDGAGTVSSPLNIDINPPKIIEFSASPDTNVWEHDKVTLTWKITSAATISLTPPLENGPSVQNPSGSLELTPTEDVSYTLSVTGASGTTPVSKTISFGVTKVIINSFTLSPELLIPGTTDNQITLTWDTVAQITSIDQGIGVVSQSGSSLVQSPPNATIYTLTAGTTQNPALVSKAVQIANLYGPFPFNQFAPAEGGFYGNMPLFSGTNFSIQLPAFFVGSDIISLETFRNYLDTPLPARYLVTLSGVEIVGNTDVVTITGTLNAEKSIFTIVCVNNWGVGEPISFAGNFAWINPAQQKGTITITEIIKS